MQSTPKASACLSLIFLEENTKYLNYRVQRGRASPQEEEELSLRVL